MKKIIEKNIFQLNKKMVVFLITYFLLAIPMDVQGRVKVIIEYTNKTALSPKLVAPKDNGTKKSLSDLSLNQPTQSSKSVTPKPLPSPVIAKVNIPTSDVVEQLRQATIAEFGEEHWDAMSTLLVRESGISPCKINGGAIDCNYNGTKACGIFQAMPCTKLTAVCGDLSNVSCQIAWGMSYVKRRYKTPTLAWIHWQKRVPINGKDVGNWY